MASPWQWDKASARYRDTRTGRYIGPSTMIRLRDTFSTAMGDQARAVTQTLINTGTADGLVRWVQDMRQVVKTTIIDEYILGRGGRAQMTQADWGRVGQLVREQYYFINNFANDIMNGKLSPAQMLARAQMYGQVGTEAYERAMMQAIGGPNLPAYPGDGTSECLVYCRCHWHVEDKGDHWAATWLLGPIERHCHTCVGRSTDWAPLLLGK